MPRKIIKFFFFLRILVFIFSKIKIILSDQNQKNQIKIVYYCFPIINYIKQMKMLKSSKTLSPSSKEKQKIDNYGFILENKLNK